MEVSSFNNTMLLYNSTEPTETATVNVFMEEVTSMVIFKIANVIAKCWIPVLVPIGLVGNTLSFLIMVKPNNRKMSTCIFMAAISINDNMMMFLALHDWLVNTLKVYQMYDLECKIAAPFFLHGLQNSTMQVIAMTFDKYVAIKWPHKSATFSTPRRAKITVVLVWVCVFIYNIPHLFFTKMVGDVCMGYSTGGFITKVYSWLSFSLNAVIPFTLLIYMNYIIIKKVRSSRKMFRDNKSQGSPKGQGQNNAVCSRREQTMKNNETQLTTMLLLVTTLFLILMFPANIRFVYSNFVTRDTPTKYGNLMFFYHLSYTLYITNNGVNFFLYCISGQKFRNDLKELLSCGRRAGECNNTSRSIGKIMIITESQSSFLY